MGVRDLACGLVVVDGTLRHSSSAKGLVPEAIGAKLPYRLRKDYVMILTK